MGAASILNDVIGPVMRGPSSSHTAGAYRIARMVSDLAGGRPESVRCAFDPEGSYAPTYKPLGVDLAFAAGLLGWDMTDGRYGRSLDAIREAGTDLSFSIEKLKWADHPNAVRVRIRVERGAGLEVWARSTGGGIVDIYRVDGREVAIDGRCWTVLVHLDTVAAAAAAGTVAAALGAGPEAVPGSPGESGFLQVDVSRDPKGALEAVRRIPGVERVRVVGPVLYPQPGRVLCDSSSAMESRARSAGRTLGEVALECEAALLGMDASSVSLEMRERYAVMRRSLEEGLADANVRMPLTGPSAARILGAERRGEVAVGGMTTRAAARAMAVMHVCNSKGVVCAAPTGGSAGVLPAVLATLETECRADAAALERALWAAGAVGLVFAVRATFAAETAGCQVEIGAAGAMAAAAVVEWAGGTAKQALDAAAIALQNTMGSVCDPVGGGCEIPCHTRNAVAAAGAFVCADLVMGGYTNPVPLDETVDASYAVGRALPRELRCTALGGIAVTPSAERLAGGG